MRLSEIAKLFETVDIDAEWEEAQNFKTVCLTTNGIDHGVTHLQKTPTIAHHQRGVYRHTAVIGGESMLLYIGKSEARTSSIASRQNNHLRAYEKPEVTSESSGKKYRQFMKEQVLTELVITIDYVDMTDMPMAMIPMFERASIDYLMPALNQ
jgi:hypothetical protein